MADPIITPAIARSRIGLSAAAVHRDAEIADLIAAAVAHVEDLSDHLIGERQVQVIILGADDEGFVQIFAWPVKSVDEFHYRDGSSDAKTVAIPGDLVVYSAARPARIQVGVGSWPSDYVAEGVLTVTAGHETLTDVPPKLVQAVLLLVAQWFEDPTGERPISPQVKALCYASRNLA